MFLADFMRLEGISDRQMAKKIGRARTTVLRYRTGEMFPSPDVMERIRVVSGHRVTANDFVAQRAANRDQPDA